MLARLVVGYTRCNNAFAAEHLRILAACNDTRQATILRPSVDVLAFGPRWFGSTHHGTSGERREPPPNASIVHL